jgi:hypothetical protein
MSDAILLQMLRRITRDQGSIEVEEGADPRTLRAGLDLGHGTRQTLRDAARPGSPGAAATGCGGRATGHREPRYPNFAPGSATD